MRGLVAVSLVWAVVLTSCSTFRMEPVAGNGVEILQERGVSRAVLTSDTAKVRASAEWGSDLKFVVSIDNKTDRVLRIDSDQFKLFVGEPGHWEPVTLMTSAEFYNRAEKIVTAATVFVAVGTVAASTTPVERSRTTTTATVIGTGSGNSVVVIQQQERSYIDVEETNRRNADRARVAVSFAKDGQDSLADLKAHLFYSVDLEGGKTYEGWVFGKAAKGQFFKFVLPIDGKDYELMFEKVKVKG